MVSIEYGEGIRTMSIAQRVGHEIVSIVYAVMRMNGSVN